MTDKILVIGDPHFQPDNLTDVDIFITKLTQIAESYKPEIICILGDILHTHERIYTQALNKAYKMINILRKISPTYILVGNHDYINNQQFLTQNHWMNGLKDWENVYVVDDTISATMENGYKLYFVPYVPPGRFIEALDKSDNAWRDDATMIFAHQEIRGCKMGVLTSTTGDPWPITYPHVVSGHIHLCHRLQENVYYPGSIMQHTFGEDEKSIVAMITITDTGKYDLQEIDLIMPTKKNVYIDTQDLESFEEDTGNKVKITLSGNTEDFKAIKKTKKYNELIGNGVKIVFKHKLSESTANLVKNDVNDFNKILYSLVMDEKNNYLYQAYEKIVNNKDISHDDVLYL